VKRLVSFRSLASADLEEIAEYLAVRESPKRAERIVERLLERLRFLAAYPDAGTRRDDLRVGIRTWPEGPFMLLHERQVFALLDALEDHPRDHALLRLLYNGGPRVSETVALEWRNLIDGVANIRGKGGRTRVVRLSRGTWPSCKRSGPPGAAKH
jgi:site-specific recombinase XerD